MYDGGYEKRKDKNVYIRRGSGAASKEAWPLMFNVMLSGEAESDLDGMDDSVYDLFNKHFEKIEDTPPRKHLKHGMPYFKENVGQGRIVCQIEGDMIYIIRCFQHHKEYDRWLSTFK